MKTRARLKPGQKGTKRLQAEYGDRLVCVRYRYDEALRKRFKTVEIIVDEAEWEPAPRPSFPPTALVPLKIRFDEPILQSLARSAGGKWDPVEKVWWVQFMNVSGTKLEKRIAVETTKSNRP